MAYCPYSGHFVGAAGLLPDGRIVAGCNVENAVYLAVHAEWAMISAARLAGADRLLAAVVMVGGENPRRTLPCGFCRQMLHEIGGDELWLLTPAGHVQLGTLLPDAFSGANLTADQATPPS
jgi:cytidine deaminase